MRCWRWGSDSTTFTASYTITQTDIDAGTYTNTATVTGDGTGTDDVTATDNDTQPLAGTVSAPSIPVSTLPLTLIGLLAVLMAGLGFRRLAELIV